MLDTPNFFWDSEPTLHPLYKAVREYLEIKARIQVLNERCRVFLDLAEILSDAIADKKMTCKFEFSCHITSLILESVSLLYWARMLINKPLLFQDITWIIIALIIVSIVVTCSEVILRFSYLSASRHGTRSGFIRQQQEVIGELPLLSLSSIGAGGDSGVHESLWCIDVYQKFIP